MSKCFFDHHDCPAASSVIFFRDRSVPQYKRACSETYLSLLSQAAYYLSLFSLPFRYVRPSISTQIFVRLHFSLFIGWSIVIVSYHTCTMYISYKCICITWMPQRYISTVRLSFSSLLAFTIPQPHFHIFPFFLTVFFLGPFTIFSVLL